MDFIEYFTIKQGELSSIEYPSDQSINELKAIIKDLITFVQLNGNDEFVLMHLNLDLDILDNLSAYAGVKTKLEAFEECKKELDSDIYSAIAARKMHLSGK